MNIKTALKETILSDAKVVAGEAGLDAEIQWVHMVDHPDIASWVKPGYLLLSTGYNWPREHAAAAELVFKLKSKGLIGIALAVPNFIEHFPEGSIDAANQVGLPLLEIPWNIPFSTITEEIHSNIIKNQNALIERSEEIHRELTHAATTANTMSDLANALGSLLKKSIFFVDDVGMLLGSSSNDETSEKFDERRYMQFLQENAFFYQLENSNRPIMIRVKDGHFPDRLACPIRIGGELVGLVYINEDTTDSISELDIRATEHAAVIAALHISHLKALHSLEERLGYALVASLLEGRFEETPSALERAKISGWDPERIYRVGLILLDEPLPLSKDGFMRREHCVEKLRKFFRKYNEAQLIYVYLNQIIFIQSTWVSVDLLWKELNEKGAALAVSRERSGSVGMASNAEDVNSLIPLLRPGKVHYFEEIMFPRALLGDADARDLFIKTRLGTLVVDQKSKQLLETLEVLCEEGFQLANSARKLGIHISTLRYRLERIQMETGLQLEDQASRFELQVAIKLYQLTHDL